MCRNNGYGLGAAVYVRRVVEDKTNELIEVVAQLAEAQALDTQRWQELGLSGTPPNTNPTKKS